MNEIYIEKIEVELDKIDFYTYTKWLEGATVAVDDDSFDRLIEDIKVKIKSILIENEGVLKENINE